MKKPKITARQFALAGAVAGLLCHLLPSDYRAVCSSVTKIAALTCGAGGSAP